LRRFLSERGKIEPRRKTGTCAAHQRSLNVALKRARQLALLPFTAEHIRVTGVLVREPGVPPFRGTRPRPQETDGAADASAPAEPTPDGAPAEATSEGVAAESAPAVAEPAPAVAEPAAVVAAEPVVAESTAEAPAAQAPEAPAAQTAEV
jgi:small subunit ribosomal protein S18